MKKIFLLFFLLSFFAHGVYAKDSEILSAIVGAEYTPITLSALDSSIISYSDDSLIVDAGVKKKNYIALYFELGGNGVQISYSLDLRFFSHLTVKVGYGAYTENGPHDFGVLITMVNYLFFERQFHIEVGLGTITELNTQYCGTTVLPNSCATIKGTAFLGFRYQPYHGGFTSRFGYTPFFNFREYRSNWGISLGISL